LPTFILTYSRPSRAHTRLGHVICEMSFLEMSFSKVNLLIVSLGIVFFEIGVFKLTFVKCRVTLLIANVTSF